MHQPFSFGVLKVWSPCGQSDVKTWSPCGHSNVNIWRDGVLLVHPRIPASCMCSSLLAHNTHMRRTSCIGGGTEDKKMSKAFDCSTRRVTSPESYITKYTTYTKIEHTMKAVTPLLVSTACPSSTHGSLLHASAFVQVITYPSVMTDDELKRPYLRALWGVPKGRDIIAVVFETQYPYALHNPDIYCRDVKTHYKTSDSTACLDGVPRIHPRIPLWIYISLLAHNTYMRCTIPTSVVEMVRSQEERKCSILGPTQSHVSPSIPWYTKIKVVSV